MKHSALLPTSLCCACLLIVTGCGETKRGMDASELRLAFQPAGSDLREHAEKIAVMLEGGDLASAKALLTRLGQVNTLTVRQKDAIRKLQAEIRKRTSRRDMGIEDAARDELR